MDLHHLRYFVAVAERLHFAEAAEFVHVSQPGLSQQIKALEEEVGVLLLKRTKRTVALTEAGMFSGRGQADPGACRASQNCCSKSSPGQTWHDSNRLRSFGSVQWLAS